MSAQIIDANGRPAQLYQRNTWESGACEACAEEKLTEAAGWVTGSNGIMISPVAGWATLAAGIFLGFLLFRGTK